MNIRRFQALACVVAATALVLLAGSFRATQRIDLEGEPDEDTYYMHPGKPQPKNGVHMDRQHDPWARDGYVKRGSFTVERKVEHGIRDRFWLVVTGTVDHNIRCTVRGYELDEGNAESLGWRHAYVGKTAVVSDLLPTIREGQFDTLMCNDLVTGERRFFTLAPFKPTLPKTPAPWETDQAVAWMKANGLNDFTPSDAPLHGTREEAVRDTDYDGMYSPGEEWLFRAGHPPIDVPTYQEYMGGHLNAQQAREAIPLKADYQHLLKQDKTTLRRKRVWRTYWDAWQAGLAKDKADGVPESEWSQHWN